jgi:Fic family protein
MPYRMRWNWRDSDWPNFRWDRVRMVAAEEQFLLGAGVMIGTVKHLGEDEHNQLLVEAMSGEALTTSEIEGEILNRASVQSSIQRQLGLVADQRGGTPAEQGISEMMVDLYRSSSERVSDEMLFRWHRMVTAGRSDLADIGRYRTNPQPMRVVSGRIGAQSVHFEAPPSGRVPAEMKRFTAWFARTAPKGTEPLPAITRAGIAHLYFESTHPFEDGNGRIGRAISEKAIAQTFGQPLLVGLATTLLAHRKSYYDVLERASQRMDATPWLGWFAEIALEAQRSTIARVEFLIAKTKLLDRLLGKVNDRQQKTLLRMFSEGPEGFKGGLSAGNYSTITGASPATATRDLADLTEKGALNRTGERRHARYALNLKQKS